MNWKKALFFAVCAGNGVTLTQYSFSGVSSISLIVNYSVAVLGSFAVLGISAIVKNRMIKPKPYNKARHMYGKAGARYLLFNTLNYQPI